MLFWLSQKHAAAPAAFVSASVSQPHLAGNPAVPLRKVDIRAVYFVPQDRAAAPNGNWQPALKTALEQTVNFYKKQLGGHVNFSFEIYPQAVSGFEITTFYDGTNTGRGNPQALLGIRQELQKRLFSTSGDLYQKHFVPSGNDFPVLAILYEGVGGGGTLLDESDHVATKAGDQISALLLARNFLTKDDYQDYGATFLAHEFGHALGLKDNYDTETGQPFSDDIMGSGRFRPLPYTFLAGADKQALGLRP